MRALILVNVKITLVNEFWILKAIFDDREIV